MGADDWARAVHASVPVRRRRPGGAFLLLAVVGLVVAVAVVALAVGRTEATASTPAAADVLAQPAAPSPTGPLFDVGPMPSFRTSWEAVSPAPGGAPGTGDVVAPYRPGTGAGIARRGFDAGNIISDQVFYDSGAMTEPQIRSFIAAQGAGCVGELCLKNRTWTLDPGAADQYCDAYLGGAGLDTAALLAQLSTACRVNPQIMLVTLQKESSLLDRPAPTEANYDAAFGWHCPDVDGAAACDPAYRGFVVQTAGMAKQWSRYRVSPENYSYRSGRTYQIAWDVDPACGSAPVTMRNTATASLYNYTPYQPNAASLAAYPGEGDQCSSYGIRNFWFLFQGYFGSGAVASTP
ncbi:hypothetical protein [Nakamurella sp.]|uniref:hypothetical protein n=1 Tax=Nakamurella sp. TaxID=1869182 RepID=UPI003782E501